MIEISRILKFRLKPATMFLYISVLILVAFTALPLIYLITTAFKPLDQILAYPPKFFVTRPTLYNFSSLFVALSSTEVPFLRFTLNSIFISSVTVVLTVLVSSLGAYGLVKHKPKGSKIIFNLVIASLMFSPLVMQIPSYFVVSNLGLVNTLFALIIPKIAVAYNFFLMERFVGEIPDALLEAAKIDGANDFKIYYMIIMPLLRPAWATLVVFTFVLVWNDYFGPLIYITDEAQKTLPLILQRISGGAGVADLARAGASAASGLLMIAPTILIFTIMQSKVLETMAHSGIKS
jgi:ABC-type glycerol-3-phosphate transport system permease component